MEKEEDEDEARQSSLYMLIRSGAPESQNIESATAFCPKDTNALDALIAAASSRGTATKAEATFLANRCIGLRQV